MEAVQLMTNHVTLAERALLDGDIGGLEPDDVTDAARDLLAERDGFEFLYVDSDSMVSNMVWFAQLGARAQAEGKNLYFCVDDGWADSWTVIASDEEEVKAKVKLAFDEARAALEFQAIHGYMPLTDEQKEKIREDFRKYSGGFDANEAADELEVYVKHLDFHHPDMPSELVEAFLQEWSEEDHS